MDIKEFLLHDKTLNHSELARRMWPTNKSPEAYLSRKLHGARVFTRRDATRALAILRNLAIELSSLSLGELPSLKPGAKKAGPSTPGV
jgi:hypothetical protein